MIREKITVRYDQKRDRLIVENLSGLVKDFLGEIGRLKNGEPLIIDTHDSLGKFGGIWKGEKITNKDIRENRKELLKKLEGKK